jgi:hypothetical protein
MPPWIEARCRPPPQPSPVDTGEGEPRSGWEGAGTIFLT